MPHWQPKKKTPVISWARKDRNWIFLYPSSCHSEWAELRAKSLSDSLPPGSGRPSVVSLPLYPPEIWPFTMICMCIYIYMFPFWKNRPWKHTVYVLNIGCFMAILINIKPSVMYIYIHINVHDIYIYMHIHAYIYIYTTAIARQIRSCRARLQLLKWISLTSTMTSFLPHWIYPNWNLGHL